MRFMIYCLSNVRQGKFPITIKKNRTASSITFAMGCIQNTKIDDAVADRAKSGSKFEVR